jgi:hypothetical protein
MPLSIGWDTYHLMKENLKEEFEKSRKYQIPEDFGVV